MMDYRDPIEIARYYSEAAMPDTLGITVEEYELDENGNPKRDAYGYLLPPVETTEESKCRLSGLTSQEAEVAGRISATATAKIAVPVGTEISSNQSVTINGEPWNITGIMPNSPARSAQKDVLIARSS